MKAEERDAMNAYLGRNVRKVESTSSLLQSSSEWLNNGKIREVLPIWLLRRNGSDFPVEADHTLGLQAAFSQVQSDADILALVEAERARSPEFDAWIREGFISTFRNEDFDNFPGETIGGMIGHQIRAHGFDITLGVGDKAPTGLDPHQYFRLRNRQAHDFEHIITGGQFNSIGEIVVTFARVANLSQHLGPELASALSAYQAFAGLRVLTRAMLHYPETLPTALHCMEQGIAMGRASPPFWFFRWEDVLDKTPAEARAHFGMPQADFVDSAAHAKIFREEEGPPCPDCC